MWIMVEGEQKVSYRTPVPTGVHKRGYVCGCCLEGYKITLEVAVPVSEAGVRRGELL